MFSQLGLRTDIDTTKGLLNDSNNDGMLEYLSAEVDQKFLVSHYTELRYGRRKDIQWLGLWGL